VIENIWFGSAWAISGGPPFSWTMTIAGFGNRTILAEVELAKIVLPPGNEARWAKAAITSMERWNEPNPPVTTIWGFDGAPIRWFTGPRFIRYGLEVSGTGTFAYMIGKIYFFDNM
jgi:hypothetical protein